MIKPKKYIEANKIAQRIAFVHIALCFCFGGFLFWLGQGSSEDEILLWSKEHILIQLALWILAVHGIYFWYLAIISIRSGLFPPDSAIVPSRTCQYTGFSAYSISVLFFLVGLSYFTAPLIEMYQSARWQQVKAEIQKLNIEPVKSKR